MKKREIPKNPQHQCRKCGSQRVEVEEWDLEDHYICNDCGNEWGSSSFILI